MRELIENALASIADRVRILVYAPAGQNRIPRQTVRRKGELKPVLAALLCFIRDYTQIEPELTMQDIQHLIYVLAAAGLWIGGRYKRDFCVSKKKVDYIRQRWTRL